MKLLLLVLATTAVTGLLFLDALLWIGAKSEECSYEDSLRCGDFYEPVVAIAFFVLAAILVVLLALTLVTLGQWLRQVVRSRSR